MDAPHATTNDSVRDYLALWAAIRAHDTVAMAVIIDAQNDNAYPLLEASLGLLQALMQQSGWDVDAWIAHAQERFRGRT